MVISGEAGIGKSRLASEVEDYARADQALILRFQCSALQSNSDLHPLLEHLTQFAGVRRTDAEPLRSEKIRLSLIHISEPTRPY